MRKDLWEREIKRLNISQKLDILVLNIGQVLEIFLLISNNKYNITQTIYRVLLFIIEKNKLKSFLQDVNNKCRELFIFIINIMQNI
jgi:hypothetical protein